MNTPTAHGPGDDPLITDETPDELPTETHEEISEEAFQAAMYRKIIGAIYENAPEDAKKVPPLTHIQRWAGAAAWSEDGTIIAAQAAEIERLKNETARATALLKQNPAMAMLKRMHGWQVVRDTMETHGGDVADAIARLLNLSEEEGA